MKKNESTSVEMEMAEKKNVQLQLLRIIGLIVLIIGYVLVAFSEIGELKELLSNKKTDFKNII